MKKIKIILFFLITSIVTGCGFHLRGSQDLSSTLPELQLAGVNEHSDLGRELIRGLTASKVNLVIKSDTVLTVTRNQFSKRVLSVDSAGRANQYELLYQLDFSLLKKVKDDKDKPQMLDFIKPQKITERREYVFDANLVLAKSGEEMKLNNDMRQAAVLQLLRRLSFSLKAKNKAGSVTK